MKKNLTIKISTAIILVLIMFGNSPQRASAGELLDLVNLLILIDVIPEDKAENAIRLVTELENNQLEQESDTFCSQFGHVVDASGNCVSSTANSASNTTNNSSATSNSNSSSNSSSSTGNSNSTNVGTNGNVFSGAFDANIVRRGVFESSSAGDQKYNLSTSIVDASSFPIINVRVVCQENSNNFRVIIPASASLSSACNRSFNHVYRENILNDILISIRNTTLSAKNVTFVVGLYSPNGSTITHSVTKSISVPVNIFNPNATPAVPVLNTNANTNTNSTQTASNRPANATGATNTNSASTANPTIVNTSSDSDELVLSTTLLPDTVFGNNITLASGRVARRHLVSTNLVTTSSPTSWTLSIDCSRSNSLYVSVGTSEENQCNKDYVYNSNSSRIVDLPIYITNPTTASTNILIRYTLNNSQVTPNINKLVFMAVPPTTATDSLSELLTPTAVPLDNVILSSGVTAREYSINTNLVTRSAPTVWTLGVECSKTVDIYVAIGSSLENQCDKDYIHTSNTSKIENLPVYVSNPSSQSTSMVINFTLNSNATTQRFNRSVFFPIQPNPTSGQVQGAYIEGSSLTKDVEAIMKLLRDLEL